MWSYILHDSHVILGNKKISSQPQCSSIQPFNKLVSQLVCCLCEMNPSYPFYDEIVSNNYKPNGNDSISLIYRTTICTWHIELRNRLEDISEISLDLNKTLSPQPEETWVNIHTKRCGFHFELLPITWTSATKAKVTSSSTMHTCLWLEIKLECSLITGLVGPLKTTQRETEHLTKI